MSKFLHDDDNDDAMGIAIPRVFSEHSRAKNDSSNRRFGLMLKLYIKLSIEGRNTRAL